MKKSIKKVVAIAAALAVVMSLMACGTTPSGEMKQEQESTQKTAADTETQKAETSPDAAGDSAISELLGETPLDPAGEYFGISLPMTSSEYYKGVEAELTSYCKEFGIKYDLASADSDSQKQLSQFENFMTMGCTTIIIYALDLASMEDVMMRAEEEGIRVVSATMTPSNLDSYSLVVDASQDAVGTAAAQFAADWVEENYPDAEDGSIEAVLFTMSISDSTNERCDGLRKVESLNSKIKIVEDYDIPVENYMVKVKENADIMMQQHPNVKVILSYSDAYNIVIDEAMMASPEVDPSSICSVAVDKTDAVLEKIKLSRNNESTIRATIATGEEFNLTLIQAALGVFDDELNDKKQYLVDPFVIDGKNVDTFIK